MSAIEILRHDHKELQFGPVTRGAQMYFSHLFILPIAISICVSAPTTPEKLFPQSSKPADEQKRVSPPAGENEEQETRFYGNAHSYIDEPLSRLRAILPQLTGLKVQDNPEPLTDLLSKVASKSFELAQKVPNLISDEMVTENRWLASQPKKAVCLACPEPPPMAQRVEKYNYIILAQGHLDNRIVLEEYRTDRNGKPVAPGAAPRFQGFSMFWVIFSESHLPESRFRYLGQQKLSGHETFVVAFAQVPGSIKEPARIVTAKSTIPMLLQGVAWIDGVDFRILQLHMDLLAPQPQIGYLKQTSDLLYGSARIAALNLDVWVPLTVDVETDDGGELWQEQHQYSKYRLYEAKSRIIVNPEN